MKRSLLSFLAVLSFVTFAEAGLNGHHRPRRPVRPEPIRTWVDLLGSTRLNFFGDSDHVTVRSCDRLNADVRQVKVRVVQGDADIYSLRVFFGNGRSESINMRVHFEGRTESRWVDLPGNDRCITSVQVVGRSHLNGRQALVQVYGVMSRR